jgi:hypothetical protein
MDMYTRDHLAVLKKQKLIVEFAKYAWKAVEMEIFLE